MTKPVYVLGLAYSGNHESAAALLKDGVLIAASEEERFSRVKFDRSFPSRTIAFCLEEAGITIHDISHVGFFWQPWHGLPKRIFYAVAGLPHSLGRSGQNAGIIFDLIFAERVFRRETGYTGPFHYIEHHLTHAASSFFSSPFEKAAILSIDGTGETATCWIGKGSGTTLTNYKKTLWPHSLGHLYSTVTQYLGFKIFEDEYKVMGLAAYGKPTYLDEFRKIIRVYDGTIAIDLRYTEYQHSLRCWYSDLWLNTFGPARPSDQPIDERHKNIAASVQARLEEVIMELASYAVQRSGCDALCLSGGVALNATAVGKIAKSGICKKVFTNPVSGDSGCALGAANYIDHCMLGNGERHPLVHAFWGNAFSNSGIEDVLKRRNIRYEHLSNPAKTAAELIAKGHIIGWFQGRAEYGQRALGNRSIVADPRDKNMRERLNAVIKHRESFRPFAPAVLAEYQGDYFEWPHNTPFMTEVHEIKKERRAAIPAVTHIDGTARLQTVRKETNPQFAELIAEFYRLTGVPIVLNTSFNQGGEPIVNSPDDAITTFLKIGLDDLIVGNFLVRREDA